MKILIDTGTIRENPEYNRSGCEEYVPGRKTFTATIQGSNEAFIDGENCHLISISVPSNSNIIKEYMITCPELATKIANKEIDVESFEIEQDVIDVTCLPPPYWLYEYEKHDVQCDACGAIFDHGELTEADLDDYYSDAACPKCGEPECCDITYEDIDDALERKTRRGS